jgi:hypothetical protein
MQQAGSHCAAVAADALQVRLFNSVVPCCSTWMPLFLVLCMHVISGSGAWHPRYCVQWSTEWTYHCCMSELSITWQCWLCAIVLGPKSLSIAVSASSSPALRQGMHVVCAAEHMRVVVQAGRVPPTRAFGCPDLVCDDRPCLGTVLTAGYAIAGLQCFSTTAVQGELSADCRWPAFTGWSVAVGSIHVYCVAPGFAAGYGWLLLQLSCWGTATAIRTLAGLSCNQKAHSRGL